MTVWMILLAFAGHSQITGDLANDGRAVTGEIDFEIVGGEVAGIIVFDIVVDMEGKVTTCTLNKDRTTVNSTPLMISAKNRILKGLSFERGYAFPKWHNGEVQFNVSVAPPEKKK